MQGKFYELPEKYKFSTAFESKIVPLDNDKATPYLSLASQDNLKKYLPKNVDFNEKIDCLAIAGQSFVANKLNLNDDAVESDTAIRIAELFPYSYIDAFHKRDSILGVILNASYADLETNQELTKDEIKDYKKPFAVTIGGIIWKLANKKITEALENDKTKDSLYFSWELGFTDYKLVQLSKDQFNLEDGKTISTAEQIKEYDKQLRANGGSGRLENGDKIGRIIVGDVIPLGVGIVENPAGQLEPLITKAEKQEINIAAELNRINEKLKESSDKLINFSNTLKEATINVIKEQTKEGGLLSTISQENFTKANLSVKNIENNQNIKFMEKITKVTDITDESLKETKASTITNFIDEELRKANEQYKAEQSKVTETQKTLTDTQKELETVKANLKTVQDQMAAKAAEETHNQRMTYFDDTYELSKEERQAIASRVQGLNEEDFNKVKTEYELLLAAKKKGFVPFKKKGQDDGDPEDKKDKGADEDTEDKNGKKKAKADKEDEAGKEAVATALENGKDANGKLPNAADTEKTLVDKYAEAFSIENCIELSKK